MYERPPPIKPDPSVGGRWWLAAPLAIMTCSGCGLLTGAMSMKELPGSWAEWPRIAAEPAVIVSLVTGALAWAAWEGRRRGWNARLQNIVWFLMLTSFVVMVSIMRSL